MGWPLWARWASAIGLIVALDAARMAWPERDFIAGFAAAFTAILFKWGAPICAIAAGVWTGVRAADRTNSTAVGWGIGIVVCVVVGGTLFQVADQLPGVGWRLDAMMNDNCYTDWDGRANPVVCD